MKGAEMWTQFMDMHSGGDQKLAWAYIFIEAPKEEAKVIFYNRFGRNPQCVTCTCCGEDYSISEAPTLEQATAYHRGCRFAYFLNGQEVPCSKAFAPGRGSVDGAESRYLEEGDETRASWAPYVSLAEALARGWMSQKGETFLVIRADDISERERTGEVPEEGYVWVD